MSVADGSPAVLGGLAPSPNPGAIQRALGLFKLLAEADDPVTVRDVAAALRLPPSMEPRIQRLVVESAARISAVLGYRAGHALCSRSISPRRR